MSRRLPRGARSRWAGSSGSGSWYVNFLIFCVFATHSELQTGVANCGRIVDDLVDPAQGGIGFDAGAFDIGGFA